MLDFSADAEFRCASDGIRLVFFLQIQAEFRDIFGTWTIQRKNVNSLNERLHANRFHDSIF